MFYYINVSLYEIVKSETKLETSPEVNSSLLGCRDEEHAKALLYDIIKNDMMTKLEYFVDKLVKLKVG